MKAKNENNEFNYLISDFDFAIESPEWNFDFAIEAPEWDMEFALEARAKRGRSEKNLHLNAERTPKKRKLKP